MRWINKGKEFELQAEQIKNSTVYIFGAGQIGKTVYEEIKDEINIAGFIDNSIEKQGQLYLSKKVYSLKGITKDANIVFIVSVSENYVEEIMCQIKENFKEADMLLMEYQDFLARYYYYFKNEIFFKALNISLTQRCSLNCKKCSVLTPYLTVKKDASLEELKSDIDCFFRDIDWLGALSFVGGEPFLYPHLEEYLEYFMSNYHTRIKFRWNIITNGTILPSSKTLEIVKQFGGNVSISDYSQTLPNLKEKILQLVSVLEEKGVSYNIGKVDKWIDFGYGSHIKDDSDEQMQLFFDKCHMTCRLLQDKKIYYCANARFAELANINTFDANNIFDLEDYRKETGSELLEFDYGFSKQGYITMCRRCNGYLSVNRNYVEVAKQAVRNGAENVE